MADKWLVFDMMGVLFMDPDDINACLMPYLKGRGIAASARTVYGLYDGLCVGRMSSTEFWAGLELPNCDEDYLGSSLRFDPRAAAAARGLIAAHGYRAAVLSTDAAEWSAFLRRLHGIDGLFAPAVVSGEVGFRKPDPRFYRAFLDRIAEPIDRCVYIDDNASYLAAGKRLGWTTIRFDRGETAGAAPGVDYAVSSWEELERVVEEVSSCPR